MRIRSYKDICNSNGCLLYDLEFLKKGVKLYNTGTTSTFKIMKEKVPRPYNGKNCNFHKVVDRVGILNFCEENIGVDWSHLMDKFGIAKTTSIKYMKLYRTGELKRIVDGNQTFLFVDETTS